MRRLTAALHACARPALPAIALAIPVALSTGGCALPTGSRNHYITPAEMRDVYGVYALSNGDTMHILRDKRRYWVASPGLGRKEIRPVAWMVFETVEGEGQAGARLAFEPQAFATVVQITQTGPASHGVP